MMDDWEWILASSEKNRIGHPDWIEDSHKIGEIIVLSKLAMEYLGIMVDMEMSFS